MEGLSPWIIFFASIFTGNILLVYFLGMCSFLSVSAQVKTSLGLGLAVTFVLTITSALNYIVFYYILEPLGIEYLRYIAFIIVIASAVQLLEMIIERFSEVLYLNLGIFLPLITVNCAILGVAVLNIDSSYNLIESLVHGFSAGIGFTIVLVLMAGLREKFEVANIPEPLQGLPIAFIMAALMSIAFMGFAGLSLGG